VGFWIRCIRLRSMWMEGEGMQLFVSVGEAVTRELCLEEVASGGMGTY
jgi:hypothetical protein